MCHIRQGRRLLLLKYVILRNNEFHSCLSPARIVGPRLFFHNPWHDCVCCRVYRIHPPSSSGDRGDVGFRYIGILFLRRAHPSGCRHVYKTVFGASLLSLLIGMMNTYFTSRPPLVTDMTLSVLMGAMLCGVGIGVYFSHHGTSGVTDIVAAVMERVSSMSVGRTMMIVDMSIVAVSFFLPFDGDMEMRIQARTQTIIYGWISIFVYSYIADRFIGAGRQTIQFFILSDKWRDIAYRISHETGRGVTTIDTRGYWTDQERTLLLVWCRLYDAPDIFHIVHEVDPEAYITDSNVRGVWGNGFDKLKLKPRRKITQ